MKLNVTDNYYDYVKKHPACKVVIYGAGYFARKYYKQFGRIDFFCDQNATKIGRIENIPCLLPEEVFDLNEEVTLLVCIKDRNVVDTVCDMFEASGIDAELFYFFDNPAFSQFDFTKYTYDISKNNIVKKDSLKICIVYAEDGWIFGKFANRLKNELIQMGQEVEISENENPDADVNHYISYASLRQFCTGVQNVKTTMITHIDNLMKKDLIAYQAKNDAVGICMSADTMNKLSAWGIPREKLCYINPAQDGLMKPAKIVLGITNRCHGKYDYRKRDDLILQICEQIDSEFFQLKIMGDGWEEIVTQVRELGYEVDYYKDFEPETYRRLMQSLDYWIYYGFDEGAMGYLDALAAGVKTIATPQGYHLDTTCGLTYPCSTVEDFIRVLKQLQQEKKEIISAVKDWTWQNYARKHLEVWQYLTGTKSLAQLFEHQSTYMDGIFSVLITDNSRAIGR